MRNKKEIAKLYKAVSESEVLLRDTLAEEISTHVIERGQVPTDLSNPRYDNVEVMKELDVEVKIVNGLFQTDITKIALIRNFGVCFLRLSDNMWELVKSLGIGDMYSLYEQLCDKED